MPKSFSAENDMDPGEISPELEGLIQIDEIRIARTASVTRAYRLKGGQNWYGDRVANVSQDVGDVVHRLTRQSAHVPDLVVRRDGCDDGTHKDFPPSDRGFRIWLRLDNL